MDKNDSFTIREFLDSGCFSGHTGKEFILRIPKERKSFGDMIRGFFKMDCETARFEENTTTYTRIDTDSDTRGCSACGCEWTLTCDTPIENNMKYCAECGARIVSVKDRYYDYELDDYVETELMK